MPPKTAKGGPIGASLGLSLVSRCYLLCVTLPAVHLLGFAHFGTKWAKLEEPQVHKGPDLAQIWTDLACERRLPGNSLEDCVEIRCVGCTSRRLEPAPTPAIAKVAKSLTSATDVVQLWPFPQKWPGAGPETCDCICEIPA